MLRPTALSVPFHNPHARMQLHWQLVGSSCDAVTLAGPLQFVEKGAGVAG